MKKRDINTLMTIIFVALISFIIPNNVHAAEEIQCNPEAAEFTCEYEIPGTRSSAWNNGTVNGNTVTFTTSIGTDVRRYEVTTAHHTTLSMKFKICSDGNGGLKKKSGSIDWSGNDFFNDKTDAFFDDASYFEDSSGKAKCPDAYVVVRQYFDSSDNWIKMRKTEENATCEITSGFSQSCSKYVTTGKISDNNDKPVYLNSTNVEHEKFENCEAILGTEEYSLGWLIKKALLYLRLIGPILVLLLSAIDFIKAMIEGSDDSMKKAQKRLTTRLVVVILLFIIPSIINLLLDLFGFTSSKCNL